VPPIFAILNLAVAPLIAVASTVKRGHLTLFFTIIFLRYRTVIDLTAVILAWMLFHRVRTARASFGSGINLLYALKALNDPHPDRVIREIDPKSMFQTDFILQLTEYPRLLRNKWVRKSVGLQAPWRPFRVFGIEHRCSPFPDSLRAFVSSAGTSVILIDTFVPEEMTPIQRFLIFHEIGHITVAGSVEMADLYSWIVLALVTVTTIFITVPGWITLLLLAIYFTARAVTVVFLIRRIESRADQFGLLALRDRNERQEVLTDLLVPWGPSDDEMYGPNTDGVARVQMFDDDIRLSDARMFVSTIEKQGRVRAFVGWFVRSYIPTRSDLLTAGIIVCLGLRASPLNFWPVIVLAAMLLLAVHIHGKEIRGLIKLEKLLESQFDNMC
jgi:Zn-dependent protease with chaperone function